MALRTRLPGPVREEARREARLHGLLRAGLRAGAARKSPPSTPRSTATTSSTRTTTTSASPSAPSAAWSCRWCATADQKSLRRDREGDRRLRPPRPRRHAQDRGAAGRHLHHHQWRHLRLADVDADPQRAAVGHPRHAQDPGAAGGGRRQDRGAADDVPGALLRSPPRRRPGGGDLPGAGQGVPGGSGSGCMLDL